jgi:hypothetical protein
MATAAPPVRPKMTNRGGSGNKRNYWTLHMGANNVWVTRPKESKSSVVAFRRIDDAVLFGSMVETYFTYSQEWPSTDLFLLPAPRVKELTNIFLQKWEFDDLKLNCTSNMLDMIGVDQIIKAHETYTFNGNHYIFDAPLEFYQNRFNELLENY